MRRRLIDRIKFWLELQIQRGALQQLLFMAFLIVFVAVMGGLCASLLTDAFQNPAEAIWWAFLRLTDPGYLGDDEGAVLRVISTVVTVLGYVLFMGSLIAIMTQWLNRIIRTLESGFTPISMKNHILILGWTNRTAAIVRELVLSEGRVRRFLQGRGARKLKIVILAEDVSAELRQELRDSTGKSWKNSQIMLRSGSSMRIEHLHRVDFMRASAIILPGADYAQGGPEGMDSRVIKTMMSISNADVAVDRYPTVVAEIFDAQKAPIAKKAYAGQIHVISGDAFISRLIAQNVRHRGLSYVFAELLSHIYGNEVYVRICPDLSDKPFASLAGYFPKAIALGVVRPVSNDFKPILNPAAHFKLMPEDRLILIARSYEDATPASRHPEQIDVRDHIALKARTMPLRRVLMLGWSHKVTALIHEFGSYPDERFEIDVVSVIPIEERITAMKRLANPSDHVTVRQLEGDYTLGADLRRIGPEAYHNIVFLGSDWLDSSEESDARTILGYMLLQSVLPMENRPNIMVELKDPSNERLFRQHTDEVIISPVVLSHMLAHASLRQELTSVFSELFGPGGSEIFFRSVEEYQMAGRDLTFDEMQRKASLHGEIALGIRAHDAGGPSKHGVYLNPSRQKKWHLAPSDEIVVLTRYS